MPKVKNPKILYTFNGKEIHPALADYSITARGTFDGRFGSIHYRGDSAHPGSKTVRDYLIQHGRNKKYASKDEAQRALSDLAEEAFVRLPREQRGPIAAKRNELASRTASALVVAGFVGMATSFFFAGNLTGNVVKTDFVGINNFGWSLIGVGFLVLGLIGAFVYSKKRI